MNHSKRKYIDYDYDDIFNQSLDDMSETEIEDSLKRRTITTAYATKTIRSGNQLEVEIYPQFTRTNQITNSGKVKRHRDIQNNLNAKNSRKTLIRLLNTNFTNNDYFITLTYSSPPTEQQAVKNMKNFLKTINRIRKSKGLENARYIYVTETRTPENKKVRIHHHLVIEGGISMDEMESKWKHGRRNNCRRLYEDDTGGFTGLADYLIKQPKKEGNSKRWHSSKNLKKPVIRKNHRDFSNRKIKKLLEEKIDLQSTFENKYMAIMKDYQWKYNEYNGKWYLYVRMYFKE